jgi:hypothetical protein
MRDCESPQVRRPAGCLTLLSVQCQHVEPMLALVAPSPGRFPIPDPRQSP